MKALFFADYGKESMDRVRALGIEPYYIDEFALGKNGVEYDGAHNDAEIIVGFNPFPNVDIDQFDNLKFIQLVSVGFNHVPKDKIESKGILLCNNVGTTRFPISEWVVTQLLNICKDTRRFYDMQKAKHWENYENILEVARKKVTFLGAGNIAVETARKLKAFDAETTALNINEDPVENMDRVVHIDRINEILPDSDIVISCLPATADTFHMMNAERLGLMKKGSILINISRGTVIDESALIPLVKAGKFRGVALDVFEKEPLPKESELWELPGVIVTPHNAIFSDLYYSRVFDMVYENLRRYLAGEKTLNIVDFTRGY